MSGMFACDVTFAERHGKNEAFVFPTIFMWVHHNAVQDTNFRDGKYWTYNSVETWHKGYFPLMSKSAVRQALASLEDQGLIESANYNRQGRDRTKWYTVTDYALRLATEESWYFLSDKFDLDLLYRKEAAAEVDETAHGSHDESANNTPDSPICEKQQMDSEPIFDFSQMASGKGGVNLGEIAAKIASELGKHVKKSADASAPAGADDAAPFAKNDKPLPTNKPITSVVTSNRNIYTHTRSLDGLNVFDGYRCFDHKTMLEIRNNLENSTFVDCMGSKPENEATSSDSRDSQQNEQAGKENGGMHAADLSPDCDAMESGTNAMGNVVSPSLKAKTNEADEEVTEHVNANEIEADRKMSFSEWTWEQADLVADDDALDELEKINLQDYFLQGSGKGGGQYISSKILFYSKFERFRLSKNRSEWPREAIDLDEKGFLSPVGLPYAHTPKTLLGLKRAGELSDLEAKKILSKLISEMNHARRGKALSELPEYIDLVRERYNEGYSFKDMMLVVRDKCYEWRNVESVNKWLRPKTLLGKKHFDAYYSTARANAMRCC